MELLVGSIFILIGWLHLRQNRLDDQIGSCVKKDDFEEVKADLKKALNILTETRVENAKWQGLMERALEKG